MQTFLTVVGGGKCVYKMETTHNPITKYFIFTTLPIMSVNI